MLDLEWSYEEIYGVLLCKHAFTEGMKRRMLWKIGSESGIYLSNLNEMCFLINTGGEC